MAFRNIQEGCRKVLSTLFTSRWAVVTNTVSGAILFVIGDVVEQKLEIRRGVHTDIDNTRVRRMAAVGIFEGPPHHYFYKYLDVWLPGRSTATVWKKILVDQLFVCPFFNVQFFMGMAWLEGKDFQGCWREFAHKFPYVYMVDWVIWPPCQFINFYLVPTRYRVLYINVVTVFWNVFLSYMKHYDQFDVTIAQADKKSRTLDIAQ